MNILDRIKNPIPPQIQRQWAAKANREQAAKDKFDSRYNLVMGFTGGRMPTYRGAQNIAKQVGFQPTLRDFSKQWMGKANKTKDYELVEAFQSRQMQQGLYDWLRDRALRMMKPGNLRIS